MKWNGGRQLKGAGTPWRCVGQQSRDRHENGFTLIELIIVMVILPLVVGAITVALVSVFSTQSSISNRISDSGEAQVISASFVSDVQAATMVTTKATSSPQCIPGVAPGTQLLGLQSNGGQTVTSYEEVTQGTTNSLVRYVCQNGNFTAPTIASTLSYDVQSNQAACVTTTSAPTCSANVAGAGWIPAAGVTGVTLTTAEAASSYQFSLAAVPKASSNPGQLSPDSTTSNSSCGFAAPTTGTYASSLCFIDFTNWNSQLSAAGSQCSGGAVGMSASVTDTPYTMSFCLSVVGQASDGTPLQGVTTAVDGGISVTGFDDIVAVPLPTYFDCVPTGGGSCSGSEAFLGNNGFYTGVPGDPALYTVVEGSTSVVTISNIQVLDAQGNPATDWELVTGDAESTDAGNPPESITWNGAWAPGSTVPLPEQVLNLIPNSPSSAVGNACGSTAPSYNPTYLTGVGTTTVECVASPNQPGEKTGTAMLEALAPSSLTATLVGSGRQAIFLGLLLS